jgi:hypothetical protein
MERFIQDNVFRVVSQETRNSSLQKKVFLQVIMNVYVRTYVYICDCNKTFIKLVSCTRQIISEMALVHLTILI